MAVINRELVLLDPNSPRAIEYWTFHPRSGTHEPGATNSVFQTTVQRSLLRLVLRSRRLVHDTYADCCLISNEDWNFHTGTATGHPMRGDRMMASTSRTLRSVATTDSVRAKGSKSTQISLLFFKNPENSPDLSPINNLWNPLDRVVRVVTS
ncbi:hypothetical protein TNCV_1569241 [Trichonephila clavipes]|nr:hypothetical protein TNCV_1569241 [Trichonephila clavipes]